MKHVDWEQLARQVGSVLENTAMGPYVEQGGRDIARKALEAILGEDFLRDAVNRYVAGGRGGEVIRSVLILLQARSALEHCLEIYRSDTDKETRLHALALLADAADSSVLPWVHEFLDDPDEDINVIGTWVLDRLLYQIPEPTAEPFRALLEKAERHRSERVREQLADLRVRERFERSQQVLD